MSFDYRFYSLLLNKIRNQQKNQIISLTNRLEYFKHLAEKIPDEYLKASLIKYLSLQEKLGDYIPPILHKSHKIFEISNEEKHAEEKNLTQKNPDDELKKKNSTTFGGNFLKKMMSLNKPNNINTNEEKIKIEKNNIKDINNLIEKLIPQSNLNVNLDFIKSIESDRNQTLKQVIFSNNIKRTNLLSSYS